MIDVKDQFPIFEKKIKGKNLTYLDSANSSQKPKSVIDKMNEFYSYEFANVGRGIYQLASNASEKYEETRQELKKFINCKVDGEIVFTKNSTESLNLIAHCFGEKFINKGDEIISTELEHHANYVPWHFIRKKKNAVIKFIPVDDDGNLLIDKLPELITDKTKIIAVTHMSNVTGTIVDIKKIKEIADKHNIPVCVDGTQGAAHLKTDMQELGCDFYAFSAHKMYGPTGLGLLYVKYKWLEAFDPFIGGGGHRFAIGTHRAKRAKAISANPLDDIAGIGASRKRALLAHFGSAKAVSRANLADLKAVDGISAAMAEKIYDFFHEKG